MSSMVDFLMSGVLVRYPSLTLAYSEGQIGWIPYILERADKVLEPPSQLFRKHVYGCFFDDPYGLRMLDVIGEDRVTFESDYPHSDSTWPNTRKVAEAQMADLSDEVVEKLMRGNAIKLLRLDKR
jgi:predicted TIM-barrel fold metal-dependent hydrolase